MRPGPKSAYQGFLSVCLSVTSHFYLGTYVLTRCHVIDINHVLTRSHVTDINYVDRGVAARAPLSNMSREFYILSVEIFKQISLPQEQRTLTGLSSSIINNLIISSYMKRAIY